jgi:hypothetical protein
MYRQLTILFALLLVASGPMAHAQSIAASQGVGGSSFTCEPVLGPSIPGEDSFCTCQGVNDCTLMAKSGVCKAIAKKDDTVCVDNSCTCTLGGSRISPGDGLRPESEAPATRNAPKVRDHRTRDRAPAAGKAKEPVRRDHRDDAVVPMN